MSAQARVRVVAVVVALAVLPRLYRLTDPGMFDFHAWRQGDSAAFVHGYLLNGLRLFSPTVDRQPCAAAGAPFGQVEAELPVASWASAVPLALFRVTYPPPWSVRLPSVLFFAGACLYLYRLVRRLGGDFDHALASIGGFAVAPLSIFFTRSPQPDGPALFFSVALLYHLDAHVADDRRRDFFLSALFSNLLLLGKISNAFMLLPAFYVAVARLGVVGTLKRWSLWAWLPLALVPAGAWYLHAHRFAWTFEIWGDRGASKFSDWKTLTSYEVWQMLNARLTQDILGWPVIVLAVAGYVTAGGARAVKLAAVWSLAVLVFIAATLPGQRRHIYYQLPLVVPVSIAAGYGIAHLWKRGLAGRGTLAGLFALSVVLAWHALFGAQVGRFYPYFFEDLEAKDAVALLRRHVKTTFFVSTDRNPMLFYNSGRRGFFIPAEKASVSMALQCLKRSKTRDLLVDKETEARWTHAQSESNLLQARLDRIAQGKGYRIYRLKPSGAGQ